MPTSKYMLLVGKSRSACLSAVETYNRASAMYREEIFAILMINAWKLVSGYSTDRIDENCIANIEALVEIRDSATHFVAGDALLRKKLTEIALGAVRNYVIAAQSWFGISFSDLNIASIPISFDLDQKEVDAVAKKSSEAVMRFLAHMQKVEAGLAKKESDYSFTVKVDFDLIRKKADGAVKSVVVGAADADLTVTLEGDKVPPGFTWTYEDLLDQIKKRYVDFKQNKEFYDRLRAIKANDKLYYERFLDPVNRKGGKKPWYNPNALKEFDAFYTRKGPTLFEPEPA